MNRLELLKKLEKYVVFEALQLEGILDKTRRYSYLIIHRLKKAGLIHEIENGKYSIYEDPFLIASRITWPSYISSWAALRYWGLTEQLPRTIHVVCPKKRKKNKIKYGNANIEFIKTKQEYFFGYTRVLYQEKEIFIAEIEKAIIDSLLFRKISFPEAIEIIKNNRKKINIKKLLKFSKVKEKLARKIRGELNDRSR